MTTKTNSKPQQDIDYQVGENVLIESEEHGKKIIGCIEEIDNMDKSFTYTLFVNAKESLQRQYYHGQFELFKTNSTFCEKITNIIKCVEVLKFKDYVMREQPTDENPFYVVRQYLDIQENTLTPDEPKPCLCSKVVNPDGNLVMCLHCNDLFFHDKCLVPGSKCSGCGATLKEEQLIGLKRTASEADLPDIHQIKTKTSIMNEIMEEDAEQEEIEPTKNHFDADEIKQMFEAAKLAKQRKIEEQKKKQAHARQHQENTRPAQQSSSQRNILLKKESSTGNQLEFTNLSATQNEKIQQLVGRYKKFNPTGNLNGPDKKRMEVREKFFEYIVYGLQEFELNDSTLNEEEKRIQLQDQYEVARKLAVEIESNVFSINNKSNKYALTENYKQRCKLLFQNMRDAQNFNLRRKIINKTLKPQNLCVVTEMELYNPNKLREIEEQKMKILQRDTINLADQKFILKTNKGEEIIDLGDEKDLNENNIVPESSNLIEDNLPIKEINNNTMNSMNTSIMLSDNQRNNKLQYASTVDTSISSDDSLEHKVIKNPYADQSIIASLLNFIGEKQFKRMSDRLISDLPETEANYLRKRLNNISVSSKRTTENSV